MGLIKTGKLTPIPPEHQEAYKRGQENKQRLKYYTKLHNGAMESIKKKEMDWRLEPYEHDLPPMSDLRRQLGIR